MIATPFDVAAATAASPAARPRLFATVMLADVADVATERFIECGRISDWHGIFRCRYSAPFSQRYGVEKLLGGVKDLLLPGILLGMLDHQEE